MLINHKLIFCLLIISFQYYQVSSFFQFISAALGVWDMVESIIDKTTTTVDLINGKSGEPSWQESSVTLLNELVTKNNEISERIKQMDERIDGKLDNIERLIKSIPDKVMKDSFMATFTHSVRVIGETYEDVIGFSTRKKLARTKIQKFISQKIRATDGVEGLLQTIFHTVTTGKVSKHEKSLLTVITSIENTDVDEKMCENMPPQLSLYELYITILGVEVIGVSTLIYGLALNEIDKKGTKDEEPLEDEIHDIIKKQEKRMNTYTAQFAKAMKSLKRIYHNCDRPDDLIRNVTFIEIKGLKQDTEIGDDDVVSLKASRSDTSNNRVIVGMRFKMHEGILHIEIKDARIRKDYDVEDIQWVALPDMKTNVLNTRKGTDNVLTEGYDFTVVTQDIAFNFDEIKFDYGRVLTGVRFCMVKSQGDKKNRIQIQAESMEYDMKNGYLISRTEKWDKPPAENHESKLELSRDKLPDDVKQVLVIDSSTKQYSPFEEFDRDKTGGQITIPYLDAQTLETNPPTPFSGVGLHHRGVQKSTGKFGFTGYSINLAKYFENFEPSEKLKTLKEKYQKKK